MINLYQSFDLKAGPYPSFREIYKRETNLSILMHNSSSSNPKKFSDSFKDVVRMMLNINTNKNFVLWITGLSGSGKTTLANAFVNRYKKRLPNMVILDGDELRNIIVDRAQERQSYERNERIKIAL